MQLSNLIGQYHQNTGQPTESVKGVKGVENLTSNLRGMKTGNVFEGTVSSIKGSRVTLALSNGQEISARLDDKVSLQQGQSMFFQVKSNDGATIQIRPFVVDGATANLTLINALKAAGLASDAKNLSMVNTMMQEQMSIDANSINHMARASLQNPDIEISTLVQMQKLGIQLTPENAAQFENYQNDMKTIQDELLSLVESLPETMADESMSFEGLREMNAEILSVITKDLDPSAFLENTFEVDTLAQNMEQASPEVLLDLTGETLQSNVGPVSEHALLSVLGQENLAELEGALANLPEIAENPVLFLDGHLNPNATSADILLQIQNALTANPDVAETEATLGQSLGDAVTVNGENIENLANAEAVAREANADQAGEDEILPQNMEQIPSREAVFKSLFSSKAFQSLVRDVMEEQWMLKPEDVAKENSVKQLYERLESHMKQLEDIVKATGQNRQDFAENAADIRNNIHFMNEINQAYTYVQIPLKMNGQHANGDLYVYTNKKALMEGDKELSAFLHLDLDHLGSTDVSIRMKNREVSTNFYLENDASFALIEAHRGLLEERLQKKGYNVKIAVINESNHVDFVEDFLKKDQPSAGTLRRYSFDMRA